MFIRRIYYRAATGEVLCSAMMQGDIAPLPQADEATACGLTDWACLEWMAPDADVEQKATENRTLSVNAATGALVWGEVGSALPPEPEEGAETDEIDAMLTNLEEAIGDDNVTT